MAKIKNFFWWYCYKRWTLYVPKETTSVNDEDINALFNYSEVYVSPCTLNPINVGAINNKQPRLDSIKFVSMLVKD